MFTVKFFHKKPTGMRDSYDLKKGGVGVQKFWTDYFPAWVYLAHDLSWGVSWAFGKVCELDQVVGLCSSLKHPDFQVHPVLPLEWIVENSSADRKWKWLLGLLRCLTLKPVHLSAFGSSLVQRKVGLSDLLGTLIEWKGFWECVLWNESTMGM